MEAIVISGEKKSEIEILFALAKKLGLTPRKLSRKEIEDWTLALKIEEGLKTGKASKKEVKSLIGL